MSRRKPAQEPCPGSGKAPTPPPAYRWQNLTDCPDCGQRVYLTRERIIAAHTRDQQP